MDKRRRVSFEFFSENLLPPLEVEEKLKKKKKFSIYKKQIFIQWLVIRKPSRVRANNLGFSVL